MTNNAGTAPEGNNFSRRTLFKASGVAAAAVGGSEMLAACGGELVRAADPAGPADC